MREETEMAGSGASSAASSGVQPGADKGSDTGEAREIEHVVGSTVQLVAFTVGKQSYCVDIMAVREIRAWDGTTTLPNTAEFVRGVINLRGTIVPIIDLRSRFGEGITDAKKTNVVIILAINDRLYGILADSVSDILTVPEKDIHDVPATEQEDESPFIEGLITMEGKMVAMIALEQVVEMAVVH